MTTKKKNHLWGSGKGTDIDSPLQVGSGSYGGRAAIFSIPIIQRGVFAKEVGVPRCSGSFKGTTISRRTLFIPGPFHRKPSRKTQFGPAAGPVDTRGT